MARFFIPTVFPAPMRGAVSRQTSGTVVINSANTYVPINLSGTLDTSVSVNMELSDTSQQLDTGIVIQNFTGLRNNVGEARTVVVIATYDGKAGNNQAIGLKLAVNATPLDETECTSFSGPSGQFSKTMTQWILRLEAGDEITMLAANKDGTTNIDIARYKMIAYSI
jgi:hypothetical protein